MFSKENFNKMIDDQLKDLNIDEKQQMYEALRERCCKTMTENDFETQKSKFKNVKIDTTKANPMMEMMTSRMGGNSQMMKMCAEMMGGMKKTLEEESQSTNELSNLFKDWCSHIEIEIIEFIKETGAINVEKIADKFYLSKESVDQLLKNLKNAGKI